MPKNLQVVDTVLVSLPVASEIHIWSTYIYSTKLHGMLINYLLLVYLQLSFSLEHYRNRYSTVSIVTKLLDG